jgi:hypothetical protein
MGILKIVEVENSIGHLQPFPRSTTSFKCRPRDVSADHFLSTIDVTFGDSGSATK